MKFFKFLAVVAMAVSLNVMAAMSPSEIGKLIDSGQLTQAEAALQEVLQERDTAKVHYMLAQVYQQMRRPLDAKNELAKADSMDPKHSYTTNEKYQAQAAKILGTDIPSTPVKVNSPAQIQPPVTTDHSGPTAAGVVIWVLVIVGGVLAAMMVAMALQKRNERRRAKEELEGEIVSLQSRAVRLVENVENAILTEKTSMKPFEEKIAALQIIKGKVLNVYDRAKNSIFETLDDCEALMRECMALEMKLNTTVYMTAGANVDDAGEYRERRAAPRRNVSKVTKAPKVTQRVEPTPQPQVIRETTVVNQGSSLSDVLVTGMILNSMNQHSHTDYEQQRRDEERRERQREQDEADRRERQRRADEEREEENRRSSWSSFSSDSGSSSSWGSSSSDSGSSDSWSSSSSSDSGSDNNW